MLPAAALATIAVDADDVPHRSDADFLLQRGHVGPGFRGTHFFSASLSPALSDYSTARPATRSG